MSTVRQSGGDYSSTNAALTDAATTIDIDETWTADDATKAIIVTDNTTITVSGGAKHPGHWDTSLNHYRLVTSSNRSLELIGNVTAIIDGIAIEQAGTGTSDECFRCVPGTSDTVLVKNSLLQCSTDTASQDCVYTGFGVAVGTITFEQCIFCGAGRAGINCENKQAIIIEVNSCTFWDNGNTTEGGGIIVFTPSTSTVINVHNTISVGNDGHASSEDFHAYGSNPANVQFNVSFSIDSDGSISSDTDGGDGNLASHNITDDNTKLSDGDWVIVEDISIAPYDLRLQSNEFNDAEDMHSTATAEGLTIPTTDIVGTTRATVYECGAFTVAVVAAELPSRSININQAVNRAATY